MSVLTNQSEPPVSSISIRPGSAHQPASQRPPNILIVDDSSSQRTTLKALLQSAGYTVTTAPDAEAALSCIARSRFSLIISDWIMPGLTGPELCEQIRTQDHSSYVYFILLTSKASKQDVTAGLNAGADDFLSKPVNKSELFARIKAGERIINLHNELVESTARITKAHAKLQTVYNGIEKDLQAAARLQQAFLPDPGRQFPSVGYATCYHPSTHIGGDLIGIFPASEHQIVAYSIDVAGHGISSALLTVRLAQTLSPYLKQANPVFELAPDATFSVRPPHACIARLNQLYQSDTGVDQYFTMALAVIDVRTGQVDLCQAGHPSPAVLRASGDLEYIGHGGAPVGLLPQADYDSISFRLARGDRLFLYSDGITEAEMEVAGQIDDDGLAMILESFANRSLESFSKHLLQHLELLCGKSTYADDVSAICVELRPDHIPPPQAPGSAPQA
jgi:sigma-B regulation protein RsbU (phosphoserine phosphatase)